MSKVRCYRRVRVLSWNFSYVCLADAKAMPSSWGIFVLRLVTFTETKKASLENPSGPKRCWSNESTNLICWAPVLSLRIRELQCLRYLDSDAIGSLLHAWLSRITFMVVQLITFMVKLYNICGQWIYCICE